MVGVIMYMLIQDEIWKAVKGYEGFYEISNLGHVRSVDRLVQHGKHIIQRHGKLLKPVADQNGYLHVYLARSGKQSQKSIHVLVATAFIHKDSPDLEVNHKDGDKSNNCVSNLEWITHKANIQHSFAIGLRKKYSREYMRELSKKGSAVSKANNSIPIFCETDGLAFESQNAADRYYGFYPGSISSCLKKRIATFHGKQFRRLAPEEVNNYTLLS